MTVAAADLRTISTAHFMIQYTDTLVREPVEAIQGVELVLVARIRANEFRPSVVFTVVPSTTPLIDASTAAILAAQVQHPGARILSVDVFVDPNADPLDPPVGRVMKFIYPMNERLDVIVKKWVVATGTHHLHFSASFLPSQALAIEETFDWVAAHVEFAAGSANLQDAARGASLHGVRLDAQASARVAFPLEDLSAIPMTQAASARNVPASAARLLADAWGIQLDQRRLLHAIVTRGDQQAFYAAYAGNDGVLVLRSAGSSAFDFDSSQVQGYGLSAERLPADASAWLGIAPGFRFGAGTTLTLQEYTDRISARRGDEAWTEVQMSAAEGWLRTVHIPGEGYYEGIAPADDTVELRPLPSGRLFDLILRRVDSVLSDRGPQEDRSAQ